MAQKLNKWQKEVLRLEDKTDKLAERRLHATYNAVLRETQAKIKRYLEDFEKLPEYRKAQLVGLKQLEQEVLEILEDAGQKSKEIIIDHKTRALIEGYYQQIYQIEQEAKIWLDFSGLNKDFIAQAINTPVDGQRLSQRLYKARTKLARNATSIITSGVSQGLGYAKIAQGIRACTEANLNQALRIARTEGGQLRSMSRQKAQEEMVKKGCDIKKMWMSALDTRTRSTHAKLDGQTVGIDEEFTSASGAKAKAPGLFGVAEEDINCRCTVVTVVEGLKPELRRDGSGKVGKYRTYGQWAKDNGIEY